MNAFAINLDYQIDRWISFKKNVQPLLPFHVHHFTPIPLSQCKDKRITKQKEISNVRSFGEIIKTAKANNWKHVIVFEDDAHFHFHEKFNIDEIMSQLPDQFGICYLGCYIKKAHKSSIKRFSKDLHQLTGKQFRIWGAHAVIYHESVYDVMIDKIFNGNKLIITDRLICDCIVNSKQFDNFIMNPMIAFQNKKLASKQHSMHGAFNFDEMERKTLEFVNNCLIK